MSNTDNSSLHLPVVIFALITAVLTALANLLIGNLTTIDVFSFGIFFVLPVGAVIVGALGASGGLLACKYFNIKPNLIDFIVLVLIGASTMYLIYYLGYITLVLDDGTKASDIVSFGYYLDLVVTKSHLRFGRGAKDIGEAGGFGYLLLLTKFIGVLIGGAFVFATLKGLSICSKCNVYYKKIATRESGLMNTEQGQDIYEKIKSCDADNYRDALSLSKQYIDTSSKFVGTKIKVKFTLMRCPKCNDAYITEEFSAIDGSNTRELKDLNGRTNLPLNSDLALEFKKNN